MASSRSEENVSLKHFQHLKLSQCWCVLQFCFGHFCLECLADVIANVCLAINCCLADVVAIYHLQVHFKGGQTIKYLLMAPKDKDPITNKRGVIYRYKCREHGCEEEYIGESARIFAERFKAPSPIFDHCNTSGHNININNFTIVGREDQNLTRAIKEALHKGQ